jgi:hypothetical protein
LCLQEKKTNEVKEMRFKHSRQRKAVMAKLHRRVHHMKPIVLDAGDHLTGKSHIKEDRQHRALKPGKRKSSTGKVYYEYRRNRADLHPAQKL